MLPFSLVGGVQLRERYGDRFFTVPAVVFLPRDVVESEVTSPDGVRPGKTLRRRVFGTTMLSCCVGIVALLRRST